MSCSLRRTLGFWLHKPCLVPSPVPVGDGGGVDTYRFGSHRRLHGPRSPRRRSRLHTSSQVYQFCNGTSWVPWLGAGGAGYPDHIISGTTNVYVNSETSTISFTTNGSVANYFDSSGRLVTTGIGVTTNQMSATTGYFSGRVGVGTTDPSYTVHANGVITTYSVNGGGHFLSSEPVSGQVLHMATYGPIANSTIFGQPISSTAMIWSDVGNLLAIGPRNMKPFIIGTSNTERVRVAGTGEVGIATQSPTATLQVSGTFTVSLSTQTTTPSLAVDASGNVGIGTTNPRHLLDLGTSYRAGDAGRKLALYDDGTYFVGFTAHSGALGIASNKTAGAADDMTILTSGNVGIGTTSPGSILDANGTIRVRGAWDRPLPSPATRTVRRAPCSRTSSRWVCWYRTRRWAPCGWRFRMQ
jgi:hypothetical protein